MLFTMAGDGSDWVSIVLALVVLVFHHLDVTHCKLEGLALILSPLNFWPY